MKLWDINRRLRWTGFRLMVKVDYDDDVPTDIALEWVGLYGSKGWRKWSP